jgi:hypothetical protein
MNTIIATTNFSVYIFAPVIQESLMMAETLAEIDRTM